MIAHVLPKREPQKHKKKLCVDKSLIEHVLPKSELQKHQMMRCVDRNVIECVLPKREPWRHALCRQEQDRVCTAKKRALETRLV